MFTNANQQGSAIIQLQERICKYAHSPHPVPPPPPFLIHDQSGAQLGCMLYAGHIYYASCFEWNMTLGDYPQQKSKWDSSRWLYSEEGQTVEGVCCGVARAVATGEICGVSVPSTATWHEELLQAAQMPCPVRETSLSDLVSDGHDFIQFDVYYERQEPTGQLQACMRTSCMLVQVPRQRLRADQLDWSRQPARHHLTRVKKR